MTVSNCQQFARWSYFTWCLHVGLRVYFNLRKSFGLCVEGKKMIDECSANVIEDEIICSKLANKEYWIEHYEKELKNFEEFGDEGEIWFGRVAENRMVKYVTGNEQLSKSCKLIDFGCGNGSLLRALRQEGYSHLCGVDYSEEAILLARKLAERKCLENSTDQIDFRVVDLLNENINLGKFDAVLDKGTWDALSLSVDRDCRLRKYKTNICRTLRPFGFFIICSCNYSRNELESHFSSEELEFSEEIPSRNIIEFGGRSGSTTTCVIFRRV
ncbi:EEF1A lysine methyltransferase [Dirofilaria immitis]